ncbi:type IV pilus secretin PilQ [Piscinibacter aquaticus]|uniref:Type IV pilus biogenesis and competence protein PilQ n=1 Tax=Piscinibacter aquaticus TaxID=392597 RepID=A0A5C6U4A0_9BURK|nr:type IV pilus secretin PilQ [Piscinibacter aquaticus]
MKHNQENRIMSMWRVRALALVLGFSAPLAGWAQNAIQSINSTQQGTAEVVRIEMSEPLAAVPAGFTIQTPPRIAIDLPGVSNALGRNSVEINQGNLRSVNVAQAGERTRLVLNLKQATNYKAQLQGKALVLVLETSAAASAQPTTTSSEPVRFAESLNREQLALKDIDFRRGTDGAGRLVVELPNNQVGVDIRQQGQSLVLEFLRSALPENLRRKFDVADFGTPVQTFTATQQGDRVRLTVNPRGNWEHSAYQSDTQFVLEVRQQKVDPNKLTQGPGYAGEKLSLNFQNIEVRALLQVIADFTNFNVVTSDTVTGNVTLRLKDVPWDRALDIILQAKGLGLRKSGNVIWVAPKDELAAKEKAELESKSQVAQLEPLRTQAFQLNYAKAEDVAKGLSGQGSTGGGTGMKILSPRGSVIFEARTNQLFVSDIPSKLEEVQMLIGKIDVPVRRVLIEARIVIADDKFGRSLGAKLGFNDRTAIGDSGVRVGGNLNAVGAQTGQTSGSFNDTQFVNLPAVGQGGYGAATFAVTLFGASASRFLNLEVSALEAEGKGKVVSSPRVVTADQQKALIEQGTELPYQTATSSGATALQFRKANLKLEVLPQITPEGAVVLDVDVNKDSVGRATAAGFAIDTKHVKTQVLVENGGTVVIGGIFEQNERTDVTKVPFLGDVPVIGNLFKTTTKSSQRTELLIFLTPKVVTDRSTTAGL